MCQEGVIVVRKLWVWSVMCDYHMADVTVAREFYSHKGVMCESN